MLLFDFSDLIMFRFFVINIFCSIKMQFNSEIYHDKNSKTSPFTFASTFPLHYPETFLIEAYQQLLNLQVFLINELTLNKKLILHFMVKSKSRSIKSKAKSTDVGTDKISPSYMFKSGSES